MNVREALDVRFSCRAFTATPVTRGEVLERIRQGYLRRAEEGSERALEIAAPTQWSLGVRRT